VADQKSDQRRHRNEYAHAKDEKSTFTALAKSTVLSYFCELLLVEKRIEQWVVIDFSLKKSKEDLSI
jgi:hypothetical protein